MLLEFERSSKRRIRTSSKPMTGVSSFVCGLNSCTLRISCANKVILKSKKSKNFSFIRLKITEYHAVCCKAKCDKVLKSVFLTTFKPKYDAAYKIICVQPIF